MTFDGKIIYYNSFFNYFQYFCSQLLLIVQVWNARLIASNKYLQRRVKLTIGYPNKLEKILQLSVIGVKI